MKIENISELAIFFLKSITLVIILYLIFSFGFFLDKKFTEIIPRLPKYVRYILIAILVLMCFILKLMSFGFIKT